MKIETLEEYIYALGICNVRLKEMAHLQHDALISQYLQADEHAVAVTVKFHIVQAFSAIRALLEMLGEHTTIDIDQVQKQLQNKTQQPQKSKRKRKEVA